MTTVVFSSLARPPSAPGAACEGETTRHHVAQRGRVLCGAGRRRALLRRRLSRECVQRATAPPGTRRGGNSPSITHACM